MEIYFCRVFQQDNGYTVLFPDFPGCITEGATIQESIIMAEEALALHIHHLKKSNESVPKPSLAKDVLGNGIDEDGDSFVVLGVEYKPSALKRKRINVTFREDQLLLIDQAAEAAGMTRSGYLAYCATRMGAA